MQAASNGSYGILCEIGSKMEQKLWNYEGLICSSRRDFSRALYSRFAHDLIRDGELIRGTVHIPNFQPPDISNIRSNDEPSHLAQLIADENLDIPLPRNEINDFIRSTSIGDRKTSPLSWWKTNSARFPNIAAIVSNFLAIPSSSVAIESAFYTSGMVVAPSCARLSDFSIESCMPVKPWIKLLGWTYFSPIWIFTMYFQFLGLNIMPALVP